MKVANYRELMAQQAAAAVKISGAHHSSWNGRLGQIDRQKKVGGVAEWDHSIRYNPRVVDEPLQEMFRNSRVHLQDPADLGSYRSALKIVLHENVHMLASEGREHAQAQHAFSRLDGVRELEESVTELYSQQRLNDYIDELGLDQVAPGIKETRSTPVYQEYLPAAQAFADTIGGKSKVSSDEVIERLATVPADQKFRAAAEIMYDKSALPGLVPSDQRAASIDRIAEAMRPAFAEIDKLDKSASERDRRTIGGEAAREGYVQIQAMRQQWAQPAPQLLQDRSQRVEQTQEHQQSTDGPAAPTVQDSGRAQSAPEAGQAQQPAQVSGPHQGEQAVGGAPTVQGEQAQGSRVAPVGQDQGGQAVQGGQPGGQAAQVGGQSGAGGQQTAQSGELQQAMRAGLSGSAPMSSARPLVAGEQGARRGATQGGQERQGPERGE